MADVILILKKTKFYPFSALLLTLLLPWRTAHADPILFLSTQLTPITEATLMRQAILKDFSQSVDFEPYDRDVYYARVANLVSNQGGVAVVGGLQEEFRRLYRAGALESVDALWPKLTERTFLPGLSGRRMFGTDHTYFVPWMQATYLMAANKIALQYLPKGAILNRLSYDELKEWAANMFRATGKGKLGFPVGPKGLIQRFLQGFLYPSFTGSVSDGFNSQPAVSMWQYLRDLWKYVARSSLISNRMDEALLNGEVWVAWDHTARLLEAFQKQPDEFVAFPAPIGPSGRGFISVLAGLGVPKGSSSAAGEKLIEYLTRPVVQVKTMESVGFLPVVEISKDEKLSKGLSAVMQAAGEQLSSPNAILSSVPLRSADDGRSFDLVYTVTFSRIVLRNLSIQEVLERQEKILREIETNDRPKGSL
jgi:multiple sugar transport system substrate-binding protein